MNYLVADLLPLLSASFLSRLRSISWLSIPFWSHSAMHARAATTILLDSANIRVMRERWDEEKVLGTLALSILPIVGFFLIIIHKHICFYFLEHVRIHATTTLPTKRCCSTMQVIYSARACMHIYWRRVASQLCLLVRKEGQVTFFSPSVLSPSFSHSLPSLILFSLPLSFFSLSPFSLNSLSHLPFSFYYYYYSVSIFTA